MLFLFPLNIFAYSSYVYAGGESIGIELKSDYILVVGTYKLKENISPLQIGDKIISIDSKRVTNVKELTDGIEGKSNVKVGYIRNGKFEETDMDIKYDDGIYKTGLYVKDEIMGIGTLTYIDPVSNIFGCLGHEITEKVTKKTFDSNDGTIFSSYVSKIIKSKNGLAGEKIAKFNTDDTLGGITKNSKNGVYGKMIKDLNKDLYKVASNSEIKLGKATILTTINGNQIEEFEIKILKLNNRSDNHNILFEVTDKNLLKKANGIVQGMSGSPIIQGNNIIGAVTHVIVDNPVKGYGIYIEKMLSEGEN